MPCSLPITSPLAVSLCWPCCGLFSEASGLFSRLQFDLNQGTRVQFALTFFLMISFMYFSVVIKAIHQALPNSSGSFDGRDPQE
jgi:hypothetical protein